MNYIILSWIFLTPVVMIINHINPYKKIPRINFWFLLFALIATPIVASKWNEKDPSISVVPDGLHVSSMSYSKEESWGFGPGGNEAGIRVYPLSEQVANLIAERGIQFFKNLPPNQNQQSRDWRGRYEMWSKTPIIASERWKAREGTSSLNIYDYICEYGVCIDIDSAVVKDANETINSKGSYYAYGRIGMIVVNPKKKLIFYMYNG